jgi:hypothetical protein
VNEQVAGSVSRGEGALDIANDLALRGNQAARTGRTADINGDDDLGIHSLSRSFPESA